MTEPLKFFDKVPVLAGGRDAIMTRARELWTKAPPAADMKAKARGKYAVSVILEAIQDNLRESLAVLIDAHVQAVEEEYVLMEGDAPADGDTSQPALDWWTGLYEAQDLALAGDTMKMAGDKAVKKWVRSDAETSALVALILAKPVENTTRALSVCGVTPEDISALAGTGAEPEAAGAETEGGEPCNPTSEASGAVATVTGGAAPARAPRRRAPRLEGPTPVTEAAKHLLEVAADHVKDADLAEALGVSRAQVINYRRGSTLFSPDAGQLERLDALIHSAAQRLETAVGALKSAVAVAELE